MNKEISMAKSNSFKQVKEVEVKNVEAYYMFINWVVDEFNLYLMNESEILKVYFPNGWFTIRSFKREDSGVNFEIKIKGKSNQPVKY